MYSPASLSIFDELADAVVAFTDDGRYVYANAAARELFGDPNRVPERLSALRGNGQSEGEGDVVRPDGRRVRVRYRGATNFLPRVHLSVFAPLDREPPGGRSRRDGPRADLYRATFEAGPDPILLCDDARHYLDGNRAARSFLGVSKEELLKRRIDDFTPGGTSAELDRVWATFLTRGYMEGVFPIMMANGLQRSILFRARANVTPGRHASTFRVAPVERQRTQLVLGDGGPAHLTVREREVLTLLARGSTAEAIAEREVLSPETVRTHARNAMRKLGARSRPHAIALAIKRREIDP